MSGGLLKFCEANTLAAACWNLAGGFDAALSTACPISTRFSLRSSALIIFAAYNASAVLPRLAGAFSFVSRGATATGVFAGKAVCALGAPPAFLMTQSYWWSYSKPYLAIRSRNIFLSTP